MLVVTSPVYLSFGAFLPSTLTDEAHGLVGHTFPKKGRLITIVDLVGSVLLQDFLQISLLPFSNHLQVYAATLPLYTVLPYTILLVEVTEPSCE